METTEGQKGRAEANVPDTHILDELIHELVDLEESAKANRKPPRAHQYRIRIDKQPHIVKVSHMTGRELLVLAGKAPEKYMISQKFCGGQVKRIGLDEVVDFTTPGVERFMTLPLDQTEG